MHDVPRYAVPVERIRGELPRHAVVKKARGEALAFLEDAVRQAATGGTERYLNLTAAFLAERGLLIRR